MPSTDIIKYLEDNKAQIAAVAAKGMDLVLLRNLTLEARAKNPKLKDCTPESILMFCKTCAEMGTTRIGQGGIWAVPFGKEMVPIPDWRFLIQVAIDAGAIISAHAEVVYENEADNISISSGSFPNIQHNLKLDRGGEIIGAYCVTRTSETVSSFTYMTRAEIDEVRDSAPGKNADAWTKWFGEQSKKTATRRQMKKFSAAVPKLSKMAAIEDRASGFTMEGEVIERESVTMPVAKEVPETTKTEKKPAKTRKPAKKTKTPKEEKSAAAPTEGEPDEDADMVEGLISKVMVTSGTKKNKEPYTSYGVILEGQRYGSFDHAAGQYAQQCSENGVEVKLSVVKNGNFWDMLGIWPLETEATKPDKVLPPNEGTGEANEDDIPYE